MESANILTRVSFLDTYGSMYVRDGAALAKMILTAMVRHGTMHQQTIVMFKFDGTEGTEQGFLNYFNVKGCNDNGKVN